MARRIGILGGSFNPAHPGHLDISMAPIGERLAGARRVARDGRIKVTDLEKRLGTHYTAESLRAILQRFPDCRFVWLMGADNLAQIAQWRDWQQIFHLLPIAVFARP